MIKAVPILLSMLTLFVCSSISAKEGVGWNVLDSDISRKLEILNNPDFPYVLVAHRGDWRNAPENSLLAIENCVAMGVDIVEIDVRRTKDGRLILMHDESVDRTTDGTGRVDELLLSDIRKLNLRNGLGRVTRFKVPTLREALIVAKGRILVNLDKCDDYIDEAYHVMKTTGTVDQVIVKSWDSAEGVRRNFGDVIDAVTFMPVVQLEDRDVLERISLYRDEFAPVAYELIFESEDPGVLSKTRALTEGGSRIWINELWPTLNAGHDDDRALSDPEGSYGWLVANGATIIQTDRVALLIDFLERSGLRDLEEARGMTSR